jgi:prophage regulatory protein
MENQSTSPSLLPLPDVLSRCCLGKTRLYELLAAGSFPQPVRLGRRVCFVQSEVENWILQRMAERNAS